MSPDVLYSTIPLIRPAVPRVDASAILKLRRGAPRKDLDGQFCMAYETKIVCAVTATNGKIVPYSAIRVYIHGVTEDQAIWGDGTIISATGYLAFGLRGRVMALHFHRKNLGIWPNEATDPLGLGVVRCSFMCLVGKNELKEEDSRIVVRWDVELFQAGDRFPATVYIAGIETSEAQAVRKDFKSGMLGQFVTQLSQLGFGPATNRPVFAATSMQAIPYQVEHETKPETKARSLTPTPPPESTTLKRRAAGSLEANEAEAKKSRTTTESSQQGAGQSGTSRYHESRGGGRTAVLPIHDTSKGEMPKES